MVSVIVLTLVPVALVIALGWLAGKWNILDANQNGLLAALFVQFTLPAELFIGAARASPAQIENWGFLLGLALGFVVIYLLGLFLAVAVFRHDLAEGALQAMNCSFPNMAAMGIPVLGALIGPSSLLSVLVGNLVSSLVLVPVTLTLLEAGRGGRIGRNGTPLPGARMLWHSLLSSLRQPLVWAPVAGVVLAFAGVHLPEVVDKSLEMIGGASTGVALFSLGLLLSQQTIRLTGEVITNVLLKVLAQPALMGLLVLLLAVRGEAGREMILLGALPTASIAPMIALRYKAYTAESSATVLLSTVLSVLTLTAIIPLVS
jgi:predicted permease